MRGDGLDRLRQVGHGTGVVADDAQGLDDDRQQVDAGGRAADKAHREDRAAHRRRIERAHEGGATHRLGGPLIQADVPLGHALRINGAPRLGDIR